MAIGVGLAERLVAAINSVHGEHPGFRAAHARGICAEGTFTATPEARRLTRAVHMQGEPVPVTVRFSNGSGAPTRPDYAVDGRGMAVKFHLPDGSVTDMVGITLGQFFVRTPEDFLAFQEAIGPDPATGARDLDKVEAFLRLHPETRAAVEADFNQPHPKSYLTTAFNGIHSFKATNAAGESRWIRYRWEPDAGVQTIDREEARAGGREYLQDDLRARLGSAPGAFALKFFLAQDGDPLDDATSAWPADREAVVMGSLVLDRVIADQEGGCEARVFDPTVVTDGIETSDDPILHARSEAYTLSLARRKGIRHPADAPPTEASAGEAGPPATPLGGLSLVVSGERKIAVANVGGELFGFDDTCTHRGCSLAQGTLERSVVTCPCHGSQFDVTTGAVVRGPATEPVMVVTLDAKGAPQL
jgi:catalase